MDYYLANNIEEEEKKSGDIESYHVSKEEKSDNIEFHHVSNKKKVLNNTEIDRKTILKQFIDSHYEIVDIAEGTNMTLLYQHYTKSAKSNKIVEFGGFQWIIVMMPEIKSLRKGHSKTLFVNLKPASLQYQ